LSPRKSAKLLEFHGPLPILTFVAAPFWRVEVRNGTIPRETGPPPQGLSRRHSLRAPLRVRVRRSDRKVESENLSQRGVFFATDLPLTKGAAVDLFVEMPEEITGVPPAQW
jgi:hypothetical protein